MAAVSKASATAVFDLKSATLTVLAVVIKTTDLAALARAMSLRFDDSPGFFDHEPACLDLSALRSQDVIPDFEDLLALLRHHGLNPIAVRSGSAAQMAAALATGLAEAPDHTAQPPKPPLVSLPVVSVPQRDAQDSILDPSLHQALPELEQTRFLLPAVLPELEQTQFLAPVAALPELEQTRFLEPVTLPELESTQPLSKPAAAAAASPAEPVSVVTETWPAAAVPSASLELPLLPAPTAPLPTLVHDKPLRSGQRLYARGSDLVVLGLVSFGAEVIADGNIHVYGPLRGRAVAGACGDTQARIFALAMQPQLISIAGHWRTLDEGAFAEVNGKPAQVRLEGERLVLEPIRT